MALITESESHHDGLEFLSSGEILRGINQEDHKVAVATEAAIPALEVLVESILPRMKAGGRLFYIGAGTSGRLGIVDASECPPTFGVEHGKVIGLIAGGDGAIRKAVEFAEDDEHQAILDLQAHGLTSNDSVVGIAASGRTPYVIGGLKAARKLGCITGAIVCNTGSLVAAEAEFPVEVLVGPEYITGSTRMKSGSAQKLILNMLSTALMIQLGHVQGNRMVDMQLSNIKLVERGTRMVAEQTGLEPNKARELLLNQGSVRKAVEAWKNQKNQ